MWRLAATREDLLTILQGGSSLGLNRKTQSQLRWTDLGRDGLQLVWPGDPDQRSRQQPPAAIIVEPNALRDFLAWSATYLTGFRPLTAFIRVIDSNSFESLASGFARSNLERISNACVGLTLAELATYAGHSDLRQLSPAGAETTFSFSSTKALCLGLSGSFSSSLSRSWQSARRITRQPQANIGIEDLLGPWSIVLNIAGVKTGLGEIENRVPAYVREACISLFEGNDAGIFDRHVFSDILSFGRDPRAELLGPREDRVVLFEQAMARLVHSKSADRLTASFLCGYLASQIGPGSLEHGSLVAHYLDALPSVLLWYGLCVGLRKETNVLTYSGGLGRRVLREAMRTENILDRPRADVSIEELEVLATGENWTDIRTNRMGHLEIEIAPCVTTVVRWPRSDSSDASTIRSEQLVKLLADLDEAMVDVKRIQLRLAKLSDALSAQGSGTSVDRRGRRK